METDNPRFYLRHNIAHALIKRRALRNGNRSRGINTELRIEWHQKFPPSALAIVVRNRSPMTEKVQVHGSACALPDALVGPTHLSGIQHGAWEGPKPSRFG